MSSKASFGSSMILRYCVIGPGVGTIALLMVLLPLDGDLIAEQGLWGWMRSLPATFTLALIFGYLIGIVPASATGIIMSWIARRQNRAAFLPVWGGLIGASFTTLPYFVFPQLHIDGVDMWAYPVLFFIGFLAGTVPTMGLPQREKQEVIKVR